VAFKKSSTIRRHLIFEEKERRAFRQTRHFIFYWVLKVVHFIKWQTIAFSKETRVQHTRFLFLTETPRQPTCFGHFEQNKHKF